MGGSARYLIIAHDETAVIEALRFAKAQALPAMALGGGSNLLFSDAGYDGVVIAMALRGIEVKVRGSAATLSAAAGENWDALVEMAVTRDLGGIECLSGIPGLVGATPIQNVGAYGQEVSQCIARVRVLDRATLQIHDLDASDCHFSYRDSAFKRAPERCMVLGVTFSLHLGGEPNLAYAELTRALQSRTTAPTLADVRETVLALRRAKSMLLDPRDENYRSAGSFFTNPIVSAEQAARVVAQALREGIASHAQAVPQYPTPDGRIKLAAGWLVEHAGFKKGTRRGTVGISTRHALALVHHGGGSSAELLTLAREVRDGVHERFGITLTPEPVLAGFDAGFAF